jgi:hypothetical protein
MMSPEQISMALKDLRIEKVAEATGLHYNTIRAIRDSRSEDPRYSTMVALDRYIRNRGAAFSGLKEDQE